MTSWPNRKRLLVTVAVMFEAYSEGAGPSYSVQTTPLKPGVRDRAAQTWGQYGGNVGVWRLARILNRLGLRATFFTSARSAELYPEATAYVVGAGHDLAAHAYAQDELLPYLAPEAEEQMIRRSVEAIGRAQGRAPSGWISPVLQTTDHTLGYLSAAGITWYSDVNDVDYPRVLPVGDRRIVAIPQSDFMDNRTLRTNPKHYLDVYVNAFDFLYRTEPGAILPIGIHCQYGGRPLMAAIFEQVLTYVTSFDDVAVVTNAELAGWFLDGSVPSASYAERYGLG